ncbi:MAG: radical SAM protein [Desulfovibrio sp.]|jgi:wyosine [tRNA(Phe)-imidazoG37] synthetase (radical SAM superfamily)|nr:radical SAM protein [Desulfovibrio sp.]
MSGTSIRPCLVTADPGGNIYDRPELLMVCRRGDETLLPKPEELIPLPDESELFLLPGRRAVGLDRESGELKVTDELAVAAFAAPAHTLTAHPVFAKDTDAPMLPLFAYGAVGFAAGRFYVCARKVDTDPRQIFKGISRKMLLDKAHALTRRYPDNRLIRHLACVCALRYNCPAARNLCLGRYEAPLPVSNACNARCIACISMQEKDSPVKSTPQNRLDFTPEAGEIVEIMLHHAGNEKKIPVYSFGQGCEGEPLTRFELIAEAVGAFRAKGGRGTINVNSNASLPKAVETLCRAGISSLRVSLNSADPLAYARYHRPCGYGFAEVRESIALAKAAGIFVSLNLLFFPGFSDTEGEYEFLGSLIREMGIDMLQLRNLNIDPDYYLEIMRGFERGPCIGFAAFRKRLGKDFPRLRLGYFNPAL